MPSQTIDVGRLERVRADRDARTSKSKVVMADMGRDDERDDPWGYRQQSLVDRALGKLACAATGHRWWRIIDARVCGQCGKVER